MPLLQFVGMITLLGTVGVTLLAGVAWLLGRRRIWGRIAMVVPALYLLALVGVSLVTPRRVVAPRERQRFCGFYLDCHLSVRVTQVDRGPSAWTVTLAVANDARRVALAPVGLRVELVRSDSGAVRLVPAGADSDTPIDAGSERSVTVSFAAPPNGETPTLRVTEGYGVDRIIEGLLLGDDDALGRNRVELGL